MITVNELWQVVLDTTEASIAQKYLPPAEMYDAHRDTVLALNTALEPATPDEIDKLRSLIVSRGAPREDATQLTALRRAGFFALSQMNGRHGLQPLDVPPARSDI